VNVTGNLLFYAKKKEKSLEKHTKITLKIVIIITIIITICNSQIVKFENETSQINRFKNDESRVVLSSGMQNYNQNSDGNNSSSLTKVPILLDQVIDSAKYFVGPGDVFVVHIWGLEKKSLIFEVDFEGMITIPGVGQLPVNNKNLIEVKEMVRVKFSEVYKNFSLSVNLHQLKKFKVMVSGETIKNGSFIVNGVTRLTELIAESGLTDQSNKRRIVIINQVLHDTLEVDLLKAQKLHDINNNPYLRIGDQIHVLKRNEYVILEGAVAYPGKFDYKERDTIKGLIKIAGGFTRGADSNNVSIIRYMNDFDSISIKVLSYQELDTFVLMPDDKVVVYIKNDYRPFFSVTITGEVQFPGNYSIMYNKSTLADIIEKAGGLTNRADLSQCKIIRANEVFPGEREYNRVQKLNPDYQSSKDKKYILSKSLDQENVTNVNVNSQELLDSSSLKIILENQDTVFIPKKPNSIKLFGAITNQGIYPFESDKKYMYYIKMAGGLDKRADSKNIRIIKNHTEKMVSPDDAIIEPGDAIWIPEKIYYDKVKITKEVVLFIGAIATTIVSVFTIRDAIKNE